MDHIKAYYSGLKNLDINPAIPSPNTFVLGYGLFQTNLQNLGQIKTGVSWEKTPAYLIPATFALTSSQAKEQPEGGVNRNTLNFCMMTHRSKDSTNDQIRTINPSDKNAGTLNRNFFDLTKATNPDGIMCWSSHLFWERWVREEIVPTLWIDPTPIISEINSKVASRPITVSVWNDSVASKTPFMQRKLSFETGREWQGQSGRYLTVKGNLRPNKIKFNTNSSIQALVISLLRQVLTLKIRA
jgi:hypothetical protein